MKNTYYIGNFEGFKTIYCEETRSYIVDTGGDPVASEEYDFMEMFSLEDEAEIFKIAEMKKATYDELEDFMDYSSGFKFWVEIKEAE